VQHDLKTLVALPFLNKTQTRVSISTGPRGGVVVIFTVVELPVIRDITFPGLRSLSNAEALEALRESAGIWKEAAFDPVNAKKAERLVKEALAIRGRPHASVQVYVEEVSAQSVVLTFAIDEGPRGLPRGPKREPKPLRPPRKKWLRTPQVARASHTGVEIDRK
jgi:outer membrane protein insertion porin family